MSRFQIQFRLGSIPVRIEASFWLITLLLGSQLGSAVGLGLWVAIELLAVLVHELGHALAAKAFGARPEIVLYGMGGLTRYAVPKDRPYGRFASMATSFAGPFAGFVLAALTFVVALSIVPGATLPDRTATIWEYLRYSPGTSVLSLAIVLMLWINVGWGAINLLPILPLDGGNILRALLGGSSPDSGTIRALWVSALIAPATAFVLFKLGMPMAAMLFAYFAFLSIKQLLDTRKVAEDRRTGMHARLEDAQQALQDGEFERAELQARAAMEQAASPVVRRTAVHVLAVAKLEQGDARTALDVLRNLPDSETDPFLLGACLLASGRAEDSIPHLEKAVAANGHSNARALLEQARRVAHVWGTDGTPQPPSPE